MNEAEDNAVVCIQLNAGSHEEKQQLIEITTKKRNTRVFFVTQNSFVQESRRHVVTMSSITTFHFYCEIATVLKYCAINCLIPILELQQGMIEI